MKLVLIDEYDAFKNISFAEVELTLYVMEDGDDMYCGGVNSASAYIANLAESVDNSADLSTESWQMIKFTFFYGRTFWK